MSRFRRRLMGLAALRQAKADDFVRVEYIENTSNAYINTGIKSNGAVWSIDANIATTTLKNGYIIGSRGTQSTRQWQAIYINNGHFATYAHMTISTYTDYDVTENTKYHLEGTIKDLTVSCDTDTFNITNDNQFRDNSNYLAIFNIAYVPNVSNAFYGRIYSFKIYNASGTLIRDYIPMYQISKDLYGLWDRVNEEFYTSPNGTKFIGGHQIIYDAEIEYLRGTNPQYIDTGIIPNNSTGVYAVGYKFAGSDSFMLGCRNNNSNTRWAIGKSNTGWYYGWNTYNNSGIGGNPADIYLNYKNDGLFKVTSTDGTKTMSLPSLSFTPIYNIRLFGSAGVNANYTKWNGAIYKVTITQGTEIIMDLIPVRVGNVGYMYDKVSGKLFGNNGSGSFILGQDTVVYDKI